MKNIKMKVVIIILTIITLLALYGCTDPSKSSNDIDDLEISTSEDEHALEIIPNESDYIFEEVLYAFKKGDNKLAARKIRAAIRALKKEGLELSEDDGVELKMSIASLKKLANSVRDGEVKDINTLSNAITRVEMYMAHDFILISNLYVIDAPHKARTALTTAVNKMEEAIDKMKGAERSKAQAIIDESYSILLESYDAERYLEALSDKEELNEEEIEYGDMEHLYEIDDQEIEIYDREKWTGKAELQAKKIITWLKDNKSK